MKKYLCLQPVDNGKRHEIGEFIELSDEHAKQPLEIGAIELPKGKAAAATTVTAAETDDERIAREAAEADAKAKKAAEAAEAKAKKEAAAAEAKAKKDAGKGTGTKRK